MAVDVCVCVCVCVCVWCVCVCVCVYVCVCVWMCVCEVWLIDNREPVKNQGLRLRVTLNCSHYYTISPMCATDGVTIHTHLDSSRTTLSFKRDLSAHVCGPTKQTHRTARHTNAKQYTYIQLLLTTITHFCQQFPCQQPFGAAKSDMNNITYCN